MMEAAIRADGGSQARRRLPATAEHRLPGQVLERRPIPSAPGRAKRAIEWDTAVISLVKCSPRVACTLCYKPERRGQWSDFSLGLDQSAPNITATRASVAVMTTRRMAVTIQKPRWSRRLTEQSVAFRGDAAFADLNAN